ncbi:thiamine-phosphate kinase [Psychrobacter sp.]|uniref:thiamine-phosphate kinase n=1 Tax=Psychrobacter sp. TaxID=56811 RepID=UPI00264A40DC|nr:thiamine-phosphate kinase [Psychrobacter sp.]MDN6275731.1 thiamine-phosphate kinase [Psychrobacter sp.]MDN6307283.1 thiamine-phosphate kinase [Psychrobacter sp.]
MNEFELIERIFSQMQASQSLSNDIEKGIGDDAAVTNWPAGSRLVSCIDTLVQGRHFSADWAEVDELAFAIGYKAVAVNVSDIAAMGATPHSLLLALALPERLANESWLTAFAKGLFHACQLFDVTLIGGDTTRSDSLVLSVSAQGLLAADTPAIYRSGANVGDKVYVSGTLGDAAYALQRPQSSRGIELSHRLHMPTPRTTLGAALAKTGATAMIDISDGLYQDLSHICEQSNVGMHINLEQLPTSKPLASVDLSERLLCQLSGGDDYELAFTLPAHIEPPATSISNILVTCIGEVVPSVNEPAADKGTSENLDTIKRQPTLFYQNQPVTPMHPAPFATWPNLTGYQHFAG